MADAVLPLEVRQYRDDARFRRFAEVLAVPTPRIECEVVPVDPALTGGKKAVVRGARWAEESKRNYLDHGEGSRALKDVFARWLSLKSDWRKLLPRPVIAGAAAVGCAPFPVTSIPAAPATDDDANTSAAPANSRQRSLGSVLVSIAFVAAVAWYVWAHWPLWKMFIDPDAHDSFRTLGLDAGASVTDIKRVYRKLAKTMHPDQGGSQAAYMMVRDAYEELMSRERDADGRPVSGLSDEAKEGNLQVLMFIGFILGRMYEVSHLGSEFVLKLLDRRDSLAAKVTHSALHVFAMGLFLWESGVSVNSFFLLITGYNYLSKIFAKYNSPSHILETPPHIDENHVKWEARRYVLAFMLPPILYHTVKSWHVLSLAWLGRMAIGLLFVACFVMRHRPYIFLQWALQSRAFSGGNPLFHLAPLFNLIPLPHTLRLVAEVVIDDILAYALRVPAAFRVACYAMIGISSLQGAIYPTLDVLPWSTHQRWVEGMQKMFEAKESFEKKEEGRDKGSGKNPAGGGSSAGSATQKTALSAKEKKELRKEETQEVIEERARTRQSVVLAMVLIGSVLAFGALVLLGDAVVNDKQLPMSRCTARTLAGLWRALHVDA